MAIMKIARHVSVLCGLFLVPITAFGSTRAWTGAGGNAVWSNAANWGGGVAPKNGDDLVFGGQSTTNDLSGLSLSSITVTSGSPTFSGNAASIGALHVTGGALLLTNTPFVIASSDSTGGTLKLDGATIGNATMNGGTIEVTSEHGRSYAGSLTLGPSSVFGADLFGIQWAPSIDYLVVHGGVSLGGSTLALHPSRPIPAQPQTLIRNGGPGSVSGTFQGLPDGAIFNQGGFWYRITYHGGSSGQDVDVVFLAGTDTWLASSQNPSAYGVPITLLAGITAPWGLSIGIPTGTIEFFDGATSLGTVTLSQAEARLTTYSLGPGAHVLTAHYSGGDDFGPNTSTHPLAQEVRSGQLSTNTMLSGVPPTGVPGQMTWLTALVQTAGLIPTGMVTFFDGAIALGTAPVDATGRATLETSLAIGTHSIHATFNGSTYFYQSTSNTLTETVQVPAPTQTALTVSSNPSMLGAPVVLRATVLSASGPQPQGVVTFMDGYNALGMANVGADQTASLTVATLSRGVHTLGAFYLGSAAFNPSTSTPILQQVDASSDCAPLILAPPADTTLSGSGAATLTIGTDGVQPQTFQWYLGSYPDTGHLIGSEAVATITNTWAATDVWVLVTNGCGTAHASAHLSAPVPSRRRAAGH